MGKVYLVNDGDKPFEDKCGGKKIVIPPGKAAKVPDYVAYHFIGDPRILEGDDANAKAEEQKRVYMRYAAFKPEDRVKKLPKLRIDEIEEEEVVIVEAKPKAKKAKATEPEFPGLKVSE